MTLKGGGGSEVEDPLKLKPGNLLNVSITHPEYYLRDGLVETSPELVYSISFVKKTLV